MELVNIEGVLYLPGDFVFEGIIEDGNLKEGTIRNDYIKFEGSWDEFLVEKPTDLDEPDYDEYNAMTGTIYKGSYKYIGSFVPYNFYNSEIVSFEKVKVYNTDTGEFIKEEYINESDEETVYTSSSNCGFNCEPTDYTKYGYKDVLDAHNEKYADVW